LNSRKWDIAVVFMLWLQLALGLLTVPLSAFHMDGALFETLAGYVKGVVTLDGGSAVRMTDVPLVYKLHILLGFTIFLVSPFTRMIHIWSGAGALSYLFRSYQIVRTPETRAKEPVRS
jgi:nitrate reductase gamma subunit